MAGVPLAVWGWHPYPKIVADVAEVYFVFDDGRLVSLKLTDLAKGHFLLEAWGQGDPADRKRASALSGSFEVDTHRAQLTRLAVHRNPGISTVVTPAPGPAVWCVIGDPAAPIERLPDVTCVDFRIPDGPDVQFGCHIHEVGDGPGVIWVRGWPQTPEPTKKTVCRSSTSTSA